MSNTTLSTHILPSLLQKWKRFTYFILPATCFLCHRPSRRAVDLCLDCELDLPVLEAGCPRCKQALPLAQSGVCGACLKQPPLYDDCHVFWEYQTPMDYLIKQLKFNRRLCAARIIGELMISRLSQVYEAEAWPECIIPIPLHRERLQQRGFNQSLVIAKHLSKAFAIPIDNEICIRHRPTDSQTALAAKFRLRNVNKAFSLRGAVPYQHIAIFDDVITTGSTIHAMCRLFRPTVKKIDIWCSARTSKLGLS